MCLSEVSLVYIYTYTRNPICNAFFSLSLLVPGKWAFFLSPACCSFHSFREEGAAMAFVRRTRANKTQDGNDFPLSLVSGKSCFIPAVCSLSLSHSRENDFFSLSLFLWMEGNLTVRAKFSLRVYDSGGQWMYCSVRSVSLFIGCVYNFRRISLCFIPCIKWGWFRVSDGFESWIYIRRFLVLYIYVF